MTDIRISINGESVLFHNVSVPNPNSFKEEDIQTIDFTNPHDAISSLNAKGIYCDAITYKERKYENKLPLHNKRRQRNF